MTKERIREIVRDEIAKSKGTPEENLAAAREGALAGGQAALEAFQAGGMQYRIGRPARVTTNVELFEGMGRFVAEAIAEARK